MTNPADPEYRTNQYKKKEDHCISCGELPMAGSNRCLRCSLSLRKSFREQMKLVFIFLLTLLSWASLSAFGTLAGYLIDRTDGSVDNGAEIAGGACFAGGGILFGVITTVTVLRWIRDSSRED